MDGHVVGHNDVVDVVIFLTASCLFKVYLLNTLCYSCAVQAFIMPSQSQAMKAKARKRPLQPTPPAIGTTQTSAATVTATQPSQVQPIQQT